MSSQAELDVRCTCRRQPLLAKAGRDSDGKLYIHVKTWKGGRLYAEVVITQGTAYLRCRECNRFQCVRIVQNELNSKMDRLPRSIIL